MPEQKPTILPTAFKAQNRARQARVNTSEEIAGELMEEATKLADENREQRKARIKEADLKSREKIGREAATSSK